jgi:hypothetical protein
LLRRRTRKGKEPRKPFPKEAYSSWCFPRFAPDYDFGRGESLLYATCHSKTAEPPHNKEMWAVTKIAQNFSRDALRDILLRVR